MPPSGRARCSPWVRFPPAERRPRSSARCRRRSAACCRATTSWSFAGRRRNSSAIAREAITEKLKQSLDSLYRQYSQRASEQQTLTRTLGEIVRRAPIACAATAPLREALQKMADAKVRTIIVLDRDDAPVGMFTLVDLLRRVALPERSLATPVSEVMSAPIVTLPASVTAYEALHVMAERGIRQIVVVENGRLHGVINERDLFALQRVSMRQVIEGLHASDTVDKLKRAGEDIRLLTQNLLAQGVGAEPLTRTIAALNDALSRRAIELVLTKHDLDDIDWCWLALGSEGRGEQTFATDQDNALLFAAADADDAARRRERLLAVRARRQRVPGCARLSALHGQRDGEQSGTLPVDGGVEGQVPALDPAAHAAGAAECEHRVRLPAALRRHGALRRAAGMAVRVHAGESDVPAAHGAERARSRRRRSA